MSINYKCAEDKGKKGTWPILMIDDEYCNIESLKRQLDRFSIPNEYAVHPIEAAYLLEELAEEKPFGLFICDNHFAGHEAYGIDFLNFLRGRSHLLNREAMGEILKSFCEPAKFEGKYKGKDMVIFSGSVAMDQEHNPQLYDGIHCVQKIMMDNGCCETEIVYLMQEKGYKIGDCNQQMMRHKAEHGVEYNPKAAYHESMVREFFRSKGLPQKEIKALCRM